jgi:hypothetical protein
VTFELDSAPAYRVDLTKRPNTYFVIADDEGVYSGNSWRDDWTPERDVLHVERAADHPVERELQRDDLTESCDDSQSPLRFLTYTAVSHGRAAHLARRDFAAQQAFEELTDVFYADELPVHVPHESQVTAAAVRMADTIDRHLRSSARGWIAVRLADGGSDGQIYAGWHEAKTAQRDLCTYFPISPLCPWTVAECAEHLRFMTDLHAGRLTPRQD